MSPENSKNAPASKTDKILIEVMNGPEDGRRIVCHKVPITIGRGNENSVSLRCDSLISRQHASIAESEEEFVLCDLGSTNGTFIDKKRVRKAVPIEPGKLFRVGGTLLKIKRRPAKRPSG